MSCTITLQLLDDHSLIHLSACIHGEEGGRLQVIYSILSGFVNKKGVVANSNILSDINFDIKNGRNIDFFRWDSDSESSWEDGNFDNIFSQNSLGQLGDVDSH